ncbi:MAG: ABC transporter permease [Candidatus Omnitrophica bacterium]|nr:ABC transporter permease [Candidatus Omnitrophota bacterium]
MISLLAIRTIWAREMIRFYRQPSRVMGAIGTPLIFWLLIGSGFGSSFQTKTVTAGGVSSQMNYLLYFFPGTILLVLLFSSIFSTISLIQDRSEGFLQSVLVSPVSRAEFILGKIFGGTTVSFLQGVLFLVIAQTVHMALRPVQVIEAAGVIFSVSFAFTALGFVLAWKFKSVQGFHAVMNLFLMPMWFLSGAMFPPDGAPGWIRFLMNVNPLSYGLALLRQALSGQTNAYLFHPIAGFELYVLIGFTAMLFLVAHFYAARRRVEDLV